MDGKRKHLSKDAWESIRLAYASGTTLADIARSTGVPEGTIYSMAKRKGWTQQITEARAIAPQQALASQAVKSTADTLKEHSERAKLALAEASTRVAEDALALQGTALRKAGHDLRPWQQMAASVHGWDKPDPQAGRGGVNIAITITRDDMKVANVVEVEAQVVESQGDVKP